MQEFGIRENLETHKYYIYFEDEDSEQFDIWQFNSLDIAKQVKVLMEQDRCKDMCSEFELKEIAGDVWDLLGKDSVLCVLTNDTVYQCFDKESMLYMLDNPMGGGIAQEARVRNPEFPKQVAKAVLGGYRECGIDEQSGAVLYRFSTKRDINDLYSDLNLIEQSLKDLLQYCEKNKNKKIYLPRPGCGIGGLDWEQQVKPLVQKYLGKFNNVFIVSK